MPTATSPSTTTCVKASTPEHCRPRLRNSDASVMSESRWTLAGDVECLLQRDPGFAQRSFVKQPPNQGYAVRHPPRRGELLQRPGRIGRPVTTLFRDLDEAGAQGQRRLSGKVGDGQHL